jgi:AraC family transcriptional regulator, regulatory protein of adaptative response / methylated-DNA-[protein]-cysteine methyltransferase
MKQNPCPQSLAAAAFIEADPAAEHTLAALAEATGVSASYLRRCFVRDFGMSPAEYLRAVRLGRMRDALRDGGGVAAAGYEAGFGSDRAIWEHTNRGLGMPPSAYRKGGRGMTIRFTTAGTTAGWIVVGATERGVCCVLFVESDHDAESALRTEFPAAEIARDDAGLASDAERVRAMIDTGRAEGDIPLDLVGTPFQRRVWAELRAIPPGATATYAEVAERIGAPSATRAVANACAGNHAAVVVPCHRVVRTDGGLGGYRWGIERKRALLDAEKASPVR